MKQFTGLAIFILMGFSAFCQQKPASTGKKNPISAYKVAVKFTSIGTGVPDDAPLVKFVQQFKKQYKVKAISFYKVGPLGREGEFDMAFKLTELTPARQKTFIAGLKKVCAGINSKSQGKTEVVTNYQLIKETLPPRASVEKIEI
ncbi:MAG: hypothetical protein WAT19_06810 [Ferruginibacter sp.]